jgi:protein-L-isoaspartate(D-aspartate) O-methyltransferase
MQLRPMLEPIMPIPRKPGGGPGGAALAAALVLALAEPALMAMGGSPSLDLAAARERLVQEVEADVRQTSTYLGTDRLDPEVIRALRTVPRERFVPEAVRGLAYANRPLPIGLGQTISQPYIVAIMSHLIGVKPGDRVYELGTGSGYQAAVLAEIGAEVYTVEIVPELAERAAAVLAELGYAKVRVRAGDGYLGWPEAAPFDAIIVTAAGPEVPRPLVDQLKTGARLVMPLGGAVETQQLVVVTKQADGSLHRRDVLPVRFVPITGEAAPRSGPRP